MVNISSILVMCTLSWKETKISILFLLGKIKLDAYMLYLNLDTQEKQGTYLLPSTKCWFHVFFHQKYNFSSLFKWNVLLEIFEKSLFHYILRQKIQPWTRMYIILKDAQGFFVVFRSQRKVLDRKAKGILFIQTSLLYTIWDKNIWNVVTQMTNRWH